MQFGQRSPGLAPQAFPKNGSQASGGLPGVGVPRLAMTPPISRPPAFRPSPDLHDAWMKAAALVSGAKAHAAKGMTPKMQAFDRPKPVVNDMSGTNLTQSWMSGLLSQDDIQSWLNLAANNLASSPALDSTDQSEAVVSSLANVAPDFQESEPIPENFANVVPDYQKIADLDHALSSEASIKTPKELTGLEVLKAMADTQTVDKSEKRQEVDIKPKVVRGGYAMVSSMNRAAHIEDPTTSSSVPSSSSKSDVKQGKSQNEFLSEESFLYLGKIPMGIGKSLILAECKKYGDVSCIHYDAEAADLFEGGFALVKYTKHESAAAAVGRLSRRAVLFGATEKIEVRLGTREDALRVEPLQAEVEATPQQEDNGEDLLELALRGASEDVGKSHPRQQADPVIEELGQERRPKHSSQNLQQPEELGQERRPRHAGQGQHQPEELGQERRPRHSGQNQHSDTTMDRHHEEVGPEKRARNSTQNSQLDSGDRQHDEAGQEKRSRHSSGAPRRRTFREHDDVPEPETLDNDEREHRARGRRRRHEDHSREPARERRRRNSNTDSVELRSRSARGGRGPEVPEEVSSLALAIPAKPRKVSGFHKAEEAVPSGALPVLADEPTGGKQVGVRGCWAEFAVQDNRSYWVNIITGEKTSSRPHSYDNTVRTGAAINRDTRDTTNMPGSGRGHSNVFVGSLPLGLTELQFQALFERFGNVTAVKLVPEAHYGFVKFATVHNARAAIEQLNGYVLFGQQIQCKFANMDRNYYH